MRMIRVYISFIIGSTPIESCIDLRRPIHIQEDAVGMHMMILTLHLLRLHR